MENLIKALQIFAKYTKTKYPTSCEHDTLYVHVESKRVSEADILELDDLGFIVDEDLGIFKSYCFGSC